MTALRFLSTVDDEALAAQCQRVLDLPRLKAIRLGHAAVEAIRAGGYVGPAGEYVNWKAAVARSVEATRSIRPDDPLPDLPAHGVVGTRVQVRNETTLTAARRLVDAGHRPLALNFANGVQPGGGFLGGSRAQEETLCRSSALFATLEGDAMYTAHRQRKVPDSTSWSILSPRVPVFRLDDGTDLAEPWELDVITCAAPVAKRVGQELAAELLAGRIERVLAIAAAFEYRALVLGAWGCGAFGNDPARTAQDFRVALEGTFSGTFTDVVFAISDWSADRRFLGPFRDVFSDAWSGC